MTVRFANRRLIFYVAVFLLSATVLGLAAHFANVFLPRYHRDFTIFAMVVPSFTIFTFLLTLQWAQPRVEAFVIFVLWALWLAMAAWATDIIGGLQCDDINPNDTKLTVSGSITFRGWCYEMKVIQAFSWALFALFTIAFLILQALVQQAERFGRFKIWKEPIRELPWFGEAPGYYNTHQLPMSQYPYGYPGAMASPGHQIIIQPGVNGQPPTVTQVPI